jgi:hypothetical protein
MIEINCVWIFKLRTPILKLKKKCFYFYSKCNQMHQHLKFIFFWNNTTRFGRSFRQSSGVHDCTYSNRYMPNRYRCLLASNQVLQYLFDIYLLLHVQSRTPDDGRKDSPKHVKCYSKIKSIWEVGVSGWTYYRNILRCTVLWMLNLCFQVLFNNISAFSSFNTLSFCLWFIQVNFAVHLIQYISAPIVLF